MDTISPQQRSEVMRRITKTGTKPELRVRELCHSMGFRYRLHRHDLPGTPDLIFPGRRKIVFVHGCWWHRHACRLGRREPKSRRDYWMPKLERNAARDREVRAKLRKMGWSVLVVWECQTRDPARLSHKIRAFLNA